MIKKKKTPPTRPVGRPPTNNLRVVLKLPVDVNAQLDLWARKTGTTKSDLVITAFRRYVQHLETE